MKKITILFIAAIALAGAGIVSFAANDFPAYEAWAQKNQPALQYMMKNHERNHDDHDHDKGHSENNHHGNEEHDGDHDSHHD